MTRVLPDNDARFQPHYSPGQIRSAHVKLGQIKKIKTFTCPALPLLRLRDTLPSCEKFCAVKFVFICVIRVKDLLFASAAFCDSRFPKAIQGYSTPFNPIQAFLKKVFFYLPISTTYVPSPPAGISKVQPGGCHLRSTSPYFALLVSSDLSCLAVLRKAAKLESSARLQPGG